MSDLIGRQAAIEKLNERARETFSLAPGYEYYLGALHDVADDLRQMPTVDAVPVKHGEWLETPTAWIYCSACESEPPNETNVRTPFCPWCGAKMGGGKDDERP